MGAYDERLLDENMNKMELVFIELYLHEYNFFDSVREFMSNSPVREGMDKGAMAYMFRLHKNMYASADYSNLPKTDNSKLLRKPVAEWLGRVYSCFQWYYNLPSKEIVEKIPPEEVVKYFLWAGSHGIDGVVEQLYRDYYTEEEQR